MDSPPPAGVVYSRRFCLRGGIARCGRRGPGLTLGGLIYKRSRPMSRLNRFVLIAVVGWTFVCAGALALRSSAAPAAGGDEKTRAKFELYKDRGGEFRWRLRATNTQILAISGDGYKAKRDCMN